MCRFTLKKGKNGAEMEEFLRLEPVSFVIGKGRLGWFGGVEYKDDTEWIKHCAAIKIERITCTRRRYPRTTRWDDVT